MTPKGKALELCQKFGRTTLFAKDCNDGVTLPLTIAKKCALIAVAEILISGKDVDEFSDSYWQQVKTEIEAL